MSEADYLCDRVLILDRGKKIALGTPQELKNTLGDTEIIISTAEKYEKDRISGLIQFPFEIKNHKIIVAAQKGEEALVRILQGLSPQVAITGVEMKTPTLDDVFLYYTGRSLRD
jgi:ABC-2 type transport system ATP-binding protein